MTSFKLGYKTEVDYLYDDGVKSHSLGAEYNSSRGDRLAIDYSYDADKNIEQINGSLRTYFFNKWRAKVKIEHSISEKETNEASFGLAYLARCWSVELQSKHTPDDTKYLLLFSLSNLGSAVKSSL